jgi:NAD(P)-dependent dehydrogenase (short-subunit alcohol dehydrogenase family)
MKVKKHTIFMTGVTGGVGKLLTQSFIKDGFAVVGTDLPDESTLSPDFIKNLSGYYQFDLIKHKDIPQFTELVFSAHPDIDVLINNAGILDFKFLHQNTDEEVMHTLQVNLAAAILLIKNSYPYFEKKKFGRFINVSSSSSFRGFETGCLYTPTKAGLNLFTESFRKELNIHKRKTGANITINNVCPGRMATEEFLEQNPGTNPKSLVSHQKVYKHIRNFIDGNSNGKIIPVFSGKLKREILIKEIKRFVG